MWLPKLAVIDNTMIVVKWLRDSIMCEEFNKRGGKEPTRIELVDRGFAVRSLSHLGTAP